MKIDIRYFAYFREQLGRTHDLVDLPDGADVHTLWLQCTAGNPRLAGMWHAVLVAVNGEYAGRDVVLHDGDEVAFLPPVSGGAAHCRLTNDSIDVAVLERAVGAARHGAIVTFVGIVRETSPTGRLVQYLEYEAFDDMALREMEAVVREVEDRWPQSSAAIEHRLGRLAIGEASVAIAVATPHRADAFEACRYAIDRLKQSVPIWKKEVFAGGSQWVGMGA